MLLCVLARLACSPVNPHPEPQWSGAHRGLALYASRLLMPVWDVKVITPSSSNPKVWRARLTEQTMNVSLDTHAGNTLCFQLWLHFAGVCRTVSAACLHAVGVRLGLHLTQAAPRVYKRDRALQPLGCCQKTFTHTILPPS